MEMMKKILERGNAKIEDFNTLAELEEYFSEGNVWLLFADGEVTPEELDIAKEDALMTWKGLQD